MSNRAAVVALLAVAGSVVAQEEPVPIVLGGEDAPIPVFGPGTFSGGSFGSDYAINASGELALNLGIRWDSPPFFFYSIILNNGIYIDRGLGIEPVAVGGEPHPFAGPDEVYAIRDSRAFNDAGQFVFTGGSVLATGPLSFEGVAAYLLAGDKTGLRVLARNDRPDLSPELPAGTSYQIFGVLADSARNGDARLNNAGQIVYAATLTGPSVGITNEEIVVLRDGDVSTVLLREGDAAPGLPGGIVFGCPACVAGPSIAEPRLNDTGVTIILTRITGPGVASGNDQALYAFDNDGTAQLLARTTLTDPVDDRFRLLREPETNDRNEVIFRAEFGPLASPRQTLFVGPVGASVPVLAEVDDAPGLPGFTIDALIQDGSSDFVLPIVQPILSGSGDIVVAADLAGPDITPFSLNKRALFAGAVDALDLVVRAGSPAPGIDRATFTSVGNFATNTQGDIVFLALVEQGGQPLGSIWSWNASRGLRLIARDGGELPGRGFSLPVETVFFRGGPGQQSGFGDQLNDQGIALFDANFAGGVDGGIYRLSLGDDCRADLDGDGELTIFDFLAFQNLFDAGDLTADFDGNGSLTLFDFLEFQNQFDAGC